MSNAISKSRFRHPRASLPVPSSADSETLLAAVRALVEINNGAYKETPDRETVVTFGDMVDWGLIDPKTRKPPA